MRKYTLADKNARTSVDLRNFEDVITQAVLDVTPKATVQVEQNCYYVSPTPKQGDAVKIGRKICQSQLRVHCVQIPKLFVSTEQKEANHEPEQHVGGHF